MDNSVFIINGRFAVDIDKNEVLDRKTKASNRLEPRLMKLLCLFVKQMGQLVRREYIISEIWDDYPGANEGLNQAVSFLRKLLDDEQKNLIQTRPKSGYVFDAEISYDHKQVQVKKYAGLVIATLVLLLFILLAADIYLRKDSQQVNFNRRRDAGISRLDSIHQAELMKNFSKDASGKSIKKDSSSKK
ncbi:MAG: helix-turn-helix domain-containing protein [Bacteroidota bacterium]|nr:helix-turn-helix domain-containing protein [Bacteroidota bacterium]